MENLLTKEGKFYAALSYITLIGWIITYIINKGKKNTFVNFHIRQSIGIHLVMLLISYFQNFTFFSFNFKNIIPLLGIVFLVIGIYYAIRGEKKLTPLVGEYFQDWFKSI